MYKEGDKVVVILNVEEAQRIVDKYLLVSYDDTVIEINVEDAMPLTDSLELDFLEHQQKLIEAAIRNKKDCWAGKGGL